MLSFFCGSHKLPQFYEVSQVQLYSFHEIQSKTFVSCLYDTLFYKNMMLIFVQNLRTIPAWTERKSIKISM